jgi:hypothetical protein
MRIIAYSLAFLSCLATPSVGLSQNAKTVTVVGAVFYPGDKLAPGMSVGLYCTEEKGCTRVRVLSQTKPTPMGIYAMTQPGVAVDTLFVIYEGNDSNFVADPVSVEIDCQRGDACLIFASNLVLRMLPPVNDAKLAAAYIESYAKTNDIKVLGREISRKVATQLTTDKAAYVVGMTSPATNQEAYLANVLTQIKNTSKSSTGSMGITANVIKNHNDYKRTKDIRIDPKDLLEPSKLSPEKFQKLMILPHTDIRPEWADPQALKRLIESHATGKEEVSIGVAPLGGPVRPVVRVGGKPDEAELTKVLENHPEIRNLTILNQLAADKKLSPGQQAILADRMHQARPVVIHGKAK